MRQAGTIAARQDAERFASYLLTLGITSKVEPATDSWAIWIHDENQIPRSRDELEKYLNEPGDPRYQTAEYEAEILRKKNAQRARQAQKNYVDMRNEWANPWRRRRVTVALIIASVLATFDVLQLPHESLLFSMPAILKGEIWRLITPIFLHAGTLHLLFNMWWLYELGSMIELALSWWRYALLVLVIALVSNFGQFLYSGPNFVGMSGVVYGLFGYAWVRGRLNPTSGLYVRQDVVFLMMIWFFLCLAGVIGNVANVAHTVGLAVGAALGALSELRIRLWPNA